MRKLLYVLLAAVAAVTVIVAQTSSTRKATPTFEDAIAIIKKYEGLHSARHWPLVGYGHKVLPGEKIARGKVLSEAEADKLLRKDFAALCARYRKYGADSLLLAALAYNTGIGTVAKSSVLSKLNAGNRDIKTAYLAHSKYRGRTNQQLLRRRTEEYDVLFVEQEQRVMTMAPSRRAGGELSSAAGFAREDSVK